jgi:hypothetical protein
MRGWWWAAVLGLAAAAGQQHQPSTSALNFLGRAILRSSLKTVAASGHSMAAPRGLGGGATPSPAATPTPVWAPQPAGT